LGAEGTALDMLGRRQEAQAVYRRGLQADPTDAALHGNLALSLALEGQQSAALTELRAAIGAPQPDPRQEANAVLVLALLNRVDEARARGAQTIGPAGTETLIGRADLARQTGDPLRQAQALGVLTSARPAQPPAPRTLLPPPAARSLLPPPAASAPPGTTHPALSQPAFSAPAPERPQATDSQPIPAPTPSPSPPAP
jgi:tetratricopeptide (TPR) repeat protein